MDGTHIPSGPGDSRRWRVSIPSLVGSEQSRARWALALCLGGGLVCAYLFRDLRHDDAFITFRYARNIANGLGFVFNPGGERVFGTTTPLFTLLIAGAYKLMGAAIPVFAVTVSALALGVQAFLVWRWLREQLPVTAALAAALILVGLADSHGYFALETNLTVALGLCAVEAYRSGRGKLCGVLLGLAFLTRYDACLFGLPILALTRRTEAKRVIPVILLGALVAVPWLVFATLYFGTPLPHTLGAKLGMTSFHRYVGATLRYGSELPGLEVPFAIRIVPLLALSAHGLLVLFRRCPPLFWFAVQAVVLTTVYAAIGSPSGHTWHVYGAVLAFRLTLVAGSFGWLEERKQVDVRWLLGVGWALAAVLCFRLEHLAKSYANDFWLGDRHRRYEEVAKYLDQNIPKNLVFLSSEVGTLGYLTDDRMIDPYGLINWTNDWPHTYRPEAYAALVVHYKPDLILLDTPEMASELALNAPSEHYRVVKVFAWNRPWSTLAIRER